MKWNTRTACWAPWLLSLCAGALFAQTPADNGPGDITAESLRRYVVWLTDPARGGRMTGSPGAIQCAEMLAGRFKQLGIQPLGNSYFWPFRFESGQRLIPGSNLLTITYENPVPAGLGNTVLKSGSNFFPVVFTENAEVEGQLVFAGYGLNVPPSAGAPGYNSYEKLDVTDKIVLMLRTGMPPGLDPARRLQYGRYAGLRYRGMMARERGAKAVLFAGDLVALAGRAVPGGSGVIAASITEKVADALLAPGGRTLSALQAMLAGGAQRAEGAFTLPGVRVKLVTSVQHEVKEDNNVVCAMQPIGTNEYVVIGAHYDHLGYGDTPGSMARPGEEGRLHPGADDNASGTATLMEVAASLARERASHDGSTVSPAGTNHFPLPVAPIKFQRGLLFVAWSGEEIGLRGSEAFAEHPPIPLSSIAAYVNFDMVGRLRENNLFVEGATSFDTWSKLRDKCNARAGFKITPRDDPYLPTDSTSFYPKRIPALSFFTGIHEDYHRPTDTPDKIDYGGMERIAKFARELILDLASSPERPHFTRRMKTIPDAGLHEVLHPYLGIIFDYTVSKGGKISAVRAGSPAEKAGVQGGDILEQLNDQKIEKVEDFTKKLEKAEIGSPVKLRIRRGTETLELEATPDARR